MSIDILRVLNRGIIQAEINSLNRNINSLSVIKFNIDNLRELNISETPKIELLFQVIQEVLNINKFIYLDDSFYLFLRDKKIHEANEVANKIEKRVNLCNLEKINLITNFEITELYRDDTVDSLINRFKISNQNIEESEHIEEKYSKDEDIKEIIETFHTIQAQDKIIKVHNFYKGINIFRSVNIISVAHNGLVFETNHTRAMILKKETFTFIKHNLFPKVVKANIANVDVKRALVYLRNFEYLQSSPVERKAMRVSPKEPIIITVLTLDNKVIFDGFIIDLSIKSVAIKVSQHKIKFNVKEYIKVKFIIPNENYKEQLIISRAIFFAARGTQIVLNIFPNEILKTKLLDYVTLRQKELVKELKEQLF